MKNIFLPSGFFLLLFYLIGCNGKTVKTAQNKPPAAPELKSVFINGDSIHYIDIGSGDPVIFVHGALGDYRTWQSQMDAFAKNHRVIAYSRRFAYPNKQVIDDSADYTVVPHARDLAELIKVLDFKSVHLVGHSSGAFIALLTTIDHPELVRSLTLAEPPVASLLRNVAGGDTIMSKFFTQTFPPAVAAFKQNDSKKAAQAFLDGVIGDSAFWFKLSPQEQNIMTDNTLELRGMLFSKKSSPEISCLDVKNIKTPILLVQGDRSPLFFGAIINELDQCLENKEHATLPNSSHGLEYQNPSQFNKSVLEFIDKH
jgi:pimeloyl-ACP methyl ester carboxylesterase